jgi:hypothetical protein
MWICHGPCKKRGGGDKSDGEDGGEEGEEEGDVEDVIKAGLYSQLETWGMNSPSFTPTFLELD